MASRTLIAQTIKLDRQYELGNISGKSAMMIAATRKQKRRNVKNL